MKQAATRDAARLRECTQDPIFLFQARRWLVIGVPDGYETDADCDVVHKETGEALTKQQLAEHVHGDYDVPCAIETWETEAVFLSRERGEAYGEACAHNYRDGWRVYCVPARGSLAHLLAKHGEEYWTR